MMFFVFSHVYYTPSLSFTFDPFLDNVSDSSLARAVR